jgi:DNA-binding transcriptional regulator GbsR (MarR family)
MMANKIEMPETMYRASRYFRILGNPTAYSILRSLGMQRKTPRTLSEELKISLPNICMTLRNLRQVNLVRYVTKGNNKEYWLKDKGILKVFNEAEKLAERMRKIQS